MRPTGFVSLGYRNKKTGLFTPLVEEKNLVLYGAADAMARLVSGDQRYSIGAMYYHYINSFTPPPIPPPPTRQSGADSFFEIGGLDGEDWIRLPMFSSARVSAFHPTGSPQGIYSGNMATFVATSAAHATQIGESPAHNPFSHTSSKGPSGIIGVALVCTPGGVDKTKDIVFSRFQPTSSIIVQENSYLDCFWGLTFL